MASTIYTDELADEICRLISESEYGLRKMVTQNPHLPDVATMMRWLANKENKAYDYFREQYALAKEMQADYLAERLIEISDDDKNDTIETEKGSFPNNEWINRSRLRVDVRKWLMSKILPKKYGDNLKLSGDPENPIAIQLPHGTISYEAEPSTDTP